MTTVAVRVAPVLRELERKGSRRTRDDLLTRYGITAPKAYGSTPFEMSGPGVSKHLRVLERAGLIQRGREAQYRPRTLDASPIREVAEWAGEFRRF